MLVAPSTSRMGSRHLLAQASRQAEIPVGLQSVGAKLRAETMPSSRHEKLNRHTLY